MTRSSSIYSGSRHDQLIRGLGHLHDMKKAGSEKKEPAPAPPPRAKGSGLGDPDPESHHKEHKLHLPHIKNVGGKCINKYCILITYTVLGVLSIIISAAVIIVAALGSVATKVYDTEQSSRLMAMVVIAVTAAVTLSMVIYAVIGAFRKKTKALHATGIVLLIVAVIQALVIAVAIHVTATDELSIGKSLTDSFAQAKLDKVRHVKLWAATQNDLKCCGLNSPEDYRDLTMPYYFPPNVPISCCPTYDPSRPEHSQERQKELCKVNGTYYDHGCRGTVVEVFKETSTVIVGVVVLLIVVELLLTGLGVALVKNYKKDKKEELELQKDPAPSPAQKS